MESCQVRSSPTSTLPWTCLARTERVWRTSRWNRPEPLSSQRAAPAPSRHPPRASPSSESHWSISTGLPSASPVCLAPRPLQFTLYLFLCQLTTSHLLFLHSSPPPLLPSSPLLFLSRDLAPPSPGDPCLVTCFLVLPHTIVKLAVCNLNFCCNFPSPVQFSSPLCTPVNAGVSTAARGRPSSDSRFPPT